jgi:DNA-binding NarL/FixJ family response regulator
MPLASGVMKNIQKTTAIPDGFPRPLTRNGMATGSRKAILVVGGDPVMQNGLAMIINRAPDFVVCGQAENTTKAIAAVAALRPDAVVVNVLLDGGRGLDSIRGLRSLYPMLPIIASVHDEHLLAAQAMRIGANGFVMDEDFVGSLRRTLAKAPLPQPRTNPPRTRV